MRISVACLYGRRGGDFEDVGQTLSIIFCKVFNGSTVTSVESHEYHWSSWGWGYGGELEVTTHRWRMKFYRIIDAHETLLGVRNPKRVKPLTVLC